MTKRHSYVAFYMDAWAGGTARMTRLVRSVYFDVCFHNWDKVEPMGEADQMMAFDDLGPQGQQILDVLVRSGKLDRDAEGAVFNRKAMEEARRAADLYEKKSSGGKRGSAITNAADTADKSDDDTPVATPDADKTRLDKIPSGEERDPNGSLPAEAGDKVVRKTYDVAKIAEAWNAMTSRTKALSGKPLASIRTLSDERKKKIRARLDEYSEAEMIEAINLIPERPFCLGDNDRGWPADIDFLLKPNTVTKLLEGTAYMGRGGGARTEGWMEA
jgi:hypothetical protein